MDEQQKSPAQEVKKNNLLANLQMFAPLQQIQEAKPHNNHDDTNSTFSPQKGPSIVNKVAQSAHEEIKQDTLQKLIKNNPREQEKLEDKAIKFYEEVENGSNNIDSEDSR